MAALKALRYMAVCHMKKRWYRVDSPFASQDAEGFFITLKTVRKRRSL